MNGGQVCPFHGDEWDRGQPLEDGFRSYTCDRTSGHPAAGPWSWLVAPEPPDMAGLTGMAEELGLDVELPAAIAALGTGWFEYGLVERSYASKRPADFARMVAQWGHTAQSARQYSVSSYLAGTLGRLSRLGSVAYHQGAGTGRWSYNSSISWWSILPPVGWEQRTAWVDVIGDHDHAARQADAECRAYVPGC